MIQKQKTIALTIVLSLAAALLTVADLPLGLFVPIAIFAHLLIFRQNSSEQKLSLPPARTGGISFRFDFRRMPLEDGVNILRSVEQLYYWFYFFNLPEVHFTREVKDNNIRLHIDPFFKNHPEDILLVENALLHKGFELRLSTAWLPGSVDHAPIVPMGATALILLGNVLSGSFRYGVSDYRELLNDLKNKADMKVYEEDINRLLSNIERFDAKLLAKFQDEFTFLFNLLLRNDNLEHLQISIRNPLEKK